MQSPELHSWFKKNYWFEFSAARAFKSQIWDLWKLLAKQTKRALLSVTIFATFILVIRQSLMRLDLICIQKMKHEAIIWQKLISVENYIASGLWELHLYSLPLRILLPTYKLLVVILYILSVLTKFSILLVSSRIQLL